MLLPDVDGVVVDPAPPLQELLIQQVEPETKEYSNRIKRNGDMDSS
jgi:hypothetical protein